MPRNNPANKSEKDPKVESKAERDSNNNPVKEWLAAIFATIGSVCPFIVAWAIVENRHTTFIDASIVGVTSLIATGFLRRPLKKIISRTTGLLSEGTTQTLPLPSPQKELAPANEPSEAEIIQ